MEMRHPAALAILVCATVLSSHPALAQFSQQGPKLVGTDGSTFQGSSVALSLDGNTAIVGGEGAIVWTRSGGVWTQQGNSLVGSGAVGDAGQGSSVALSLDGNTAIVGGTSDNTNAGAAWVWTRTAGVWSQQGNKLVGSGVVGFANQGDNVALSADGNTAIVGGPRDNNSVGAAWVWTRSGGVWTEQSKLVGSGAVGASSQGAHVSLSADGNTAMIGGTGDNGGAGAVWVWTRSGGVWIQQGSKLVAFDAVGNANQGAVSLSGDGNTAIIGGGRDNGSAGAVWFWTRSGGVWTQQSSRLVGSGGSANAVQGASVSISGDGSTAIVGGQGDNSDTGAIWVWTRSAGVWTQQSNKLTGSGAVGSARHGHSVSISSDGYTFIEGAFFDNNKVGATWIFVRAPGIPPRRRAVRH